MSVFIRKSANAISIFLGIIFLLSGMLKLWTISSFSGEIAQYGDLLAIYELVKYHTTIAVIVCLSEMVIGIISVTQKYAMLSDLLTVCFAFLFMFITGYNYLLVDVESQVQSCNCFGDWIQLSPKISFIKTVVLLSFALYVVLVRLFKYKLTANIHRNQHSEVVIGSAMLCVVAFFSSCGDEHSTEKLFFNDRYYNIGSVSNLDKEYVHYSFLLSNASEHDVTINKVEPSCPCLTIDYYPHSLTPHEEDSITGTIDIKSLHGPINKSIFVTYNETEVTLLRIVGESKSN